MYKPGEALSGVVEGIVPFGAFIELPDGRKGLCHISKLGAGYVENVRDVVSEGQGVQVRVLRDEGQKIALALERASKRPLEPMIEKFLKDSRRQQGEYQANRTRRLGRQ